MACVAETSAFSAYCRQQRKYKKLVRGATQSNPELEGISDGGIHSYSPERETPLPHLWVPSFIDLVGDTPMLNISRIFADQLKSRNVRVLAKLEMLNPALSIESRAVVSLLSQGLESGLLREGMTIIHSSSGSNFDSALAAMCARSRFNCVIVANLSERYNPSNWKLVHVYGGEVVLAEDVASEKQELLDEYGEDAFDFTKFQQSRPQTRVQDILDETFEQTNGLATHFVTEEHFPKGMKHLSRNGVKVFHSCLGGEEEEEKVSRESSIIHVAKEDAVAMCHELAKKEGICSGRISGSNMFAAMKLAASLENSVVVTTLPDIGVKHLEDIFSQTWLESKGLLPLPAVSSLIQFGKPSSSLSQNPMSPTTFKGFSIDEIIGDTPLVDLSHLLDDPTSGVRVLAKLEYFNPGFSIKDRIIRHIFGQAEKEGRLRPGMTVVAASSGNTGAATAMLCAAKGYKCVITTSPKCSKEKMDAIRAYGAKLLVSKAGAKEGSPDHYMMMAKSLAEENPDWFDVDQYDNLDNAAAHYHSLGPEIWRQTKGSVSHFVAAGSTGGTISGTSRFLKEKNSKVVSILADPVGSIFSNYFKTGKVGTAKKFLVEGVGKGSIPGCINFDLIDDICPVTDEQAFKMAWRLARSEGICPGGSAGLNLFAAITYANTLKEPATVVTVFPDSGAKYLSKVYSKAWLNTNQLKSVYLRE